MTTIEQLEEQLGSLKAVVKYGEAVSRLAQNRDFKMVILEGFLEKDCAAFARESGNPLLAPENRADALAMAQAAGHLKRFLKQAEIMAETARRNVADAEEQIDEIRAENAISLDATVVD